MEAPPRPVGEKKHNKTPDLLLIQTSEQDD